MAKQTNKQTSGVTFQDKIHYIILLSKVSRWLSQATGGIWYRILESHNCKKTSAATFRRQMHYRRVPSRASRWTTSHGTGGSQSYRILNNTSVIKLHLMISNIKQWPKKQTSKQGNLTCNPQKLKVTGYGSVPWWSPCPPRWNPQCNPRGWAAHPHATQG